MAHFQGNNPFLTINGEDVTGIWQKVQVTESMETEDLSAGAGITHVMRGGKLISNGARVTIVYDDSTVASDLSSLYHDGAAVALVWGPEGNGAGKPKHDQDFIVTGISPSEQTHDKAFIVFELTLESDGAPRSNMLAGAVWSA